jgi:carboxyl-terminal processing protease
MKSRRAFKTVYAVLLVVAFAAAPAFIERAWAADDNRDFVRQIQLFDTVANYVRLNYVKDVDAQDLIYGGIRGMLSRLDEHTVFMEPDDFRLLLNDTEGSFGGLGIEIAVTPEDQTLTVMNVLEGTPAEKTGLKPRDKIIEIDGESTQGITTREALLKMRGEPGTTVTLGVARADYPDKLTYTVTREIIHIDTVPYYFMAAPDVGYVRVTTFARDDTRSTSRDAAAAIAELKNQGMKSLIIDLRGNPGGALDEAVDLASLFLKKGSRVVYTNGRSKRWENREYFAAKDPLLPKERVVILVDGSSASASEVFTGAMKDHKRALVVGEKTYGKASVQTLIPLTAAADAGEGPGLKLTIAYYYTPNGNLIDGKGIEPDVKLEPEKIELIVAKLFEQGYYRIYAEEYLDTAGPGGYAVFEKDPRAFEGFQAWVAARGLDFYPKGFTETLPDKGKEFYLAAMDGQRDQVMVMLTRAVLTETAGDAAAYKYWRQHDPWIARAAALARGEEKP